MKYTPAIAIVVLLFGCNAAGLTEPAVVGPTPTDASIPADAADAGSDGAVEASGAARNLRVVAANTSSGPSLTYGPLEGVRIFQGLKPDVVLIQEFNHGDNSADALATFVTTTFGPTFTYYREPGMQIPNGIISRFPIVESGRWVDPEVDNRGFAYAKIAIPGPHPLWAVSLHLLTTGSAARKAEATALVERVNAVIPAADYLVMGGDLNTGGRNEGCIDTLSQVVVTAAPYPDDGAGNGDTNAPRNKPHDWLFADADLAPHAVPTRIGGRTFAAGLVFDSRVYKPLADVAPVLATDSAAQNMQHMPVVKDFTIPE